MTRSNEETPAEEPLAQQAGLTYARWRCVRRFGKDRDYDDNQRTGNHEGKCLVDREAKLSLPLTPITSQKASLVKQPRHYPPKVVGVRRQWSRAGVFRQALQRHAQRQA
jgi:hypothetical protein